MSLDGLVMSVTATAERGVVGSDTRIHFIQKGARVLGRYAGGAVDHGCLVGRHTREGSGTNVFDELVG